MLLPDTRPRSTWLGVAGLSLLATVGWLPFLGTTLSPDEGGLLMVAGQWEAGSSLYGDHWVDRPPVLLMLVALAEAAGGPLALRIMGTLAVAVAVLLAGVVGRLAAPQRPRAPVLTAGTAAVLLATPLFGGGSVSNEVLAAPFLMGGMAAVLASLSAPGRASRLAWGVAGGAAGASAALVKQSLVDVLLLVAVLVVLRWRPRRPGSGAVLTTALGALLGAVAATAAAVGFAWLRGTDPVALFEAVVLFRFEATAVIVEQSRQPTDQRLLQLLAAFLGSGAPLLLAVLGLAALRNRRTVPGSAHRPGTSVGAAAGRVDLRWPAAALLSWEMLAMYLGGSYWLHYLTGLVPGMVLLAAAAAQRERMSGRALAVAFGFAAFSAACVVAFVAARGVDRSEQPVIDYLSAHVEPGDTGVVAFGAANILASTGLESPYQHLWSLPVRVRDPDLRRFSAVMAGPERPTWLVLGGRSLWTWAVDPTLAREPVREHYERVTFRGGFTVYRLRGVER